MSLLYQPCPCESGSKFKFCCLEAIKQNNLAHLEPKIEKFSPLCIGAANYRSEGLAIALVTRKIYEDCYIMGYYLVDLWCMGVKDTFIKTNLTEKELIRHIESAHTRQQLTNCSYEDMRNLILGSVAYAASIGITPHADWQFTKFMVEPHKPFENNVTFGRDGKPFYAAGPYDQKIQKSVIEKVTQAGGNYITRL